MRSSDASSFAKEYAHLPLWQRLICSWARRISAGYLVLRFPDGATVRFQGKYPGPEACLQIKSKKLVWHFLAGGSLGFAHAYIHDCWETDDLGAVLRLGVANEAAFSSVLGMPVLSKWLTRLRHCLHANTRRGSRRNIAYHYDLGNEFYRQWLDETMTYSSALFAHEKQPLNEAQREKYARILRELKISQNDRVLEIGCGWGGFAEYAVQETGGHVTGLTLSKEQAHFSAARMEKAGLEAKTDIRIQDYRDCRGQYDKIVSIEMFEAVGERNWPVYFDVLRSLLVPGGQALIQVITIAEERFERYRKNADFIQTYIFPGGMLPTPSVLDQLAQQHGFLVQGVKFFGTDYARTLFLWDKAFRSAWANIAGLGFDSRFKRMWRYYLHYCAIGFESKRIDVGQFCFSRAR